MLTKKSIQGVSRQLPIRRIERRDKPIQLKFIAERLKIVEIFLNF